MSIGTRGRRTRATPAACTCVTNVTRCNVAVLHSVGMFGLVNILIPRASLRHPRPMGASSECGSARTTPPASRVRTSARQRRTHLGLARHSSISGACPLGRYDGYNCTFPAMIQDWRDKWSRGTSGKTNPACCVPLPFAPCRVPVLLERPAARPTPLAPRPVP